MRTSLAILALCLLAAPVRAGEEDLQVAAARAVDAVAEAVGLPPGGPFEVRAADPEVVEGFWRERFDRIPQFARLRRLAVRAGPRVASVVSALTRLSERGAYFDPEERTLFVRRDAVSEPAVAAELVRAARGWEAFLSAPDLTFDEFLARFAVVEGEAAWMARRLSGRRESSLPQVLTAFSRGPEEAGARLVDLVRAEDGAKGVARLYLEPPVSMEQVLHPEKRAEPADVPDLVDTAALESSLPDGWSVVERATLGECALQFLSLLGSDRKSRGAGGVIAATVGWDGDRLLVCRHGETGRQVVVWCLAFDSPRDARQCAEFGFPGDELDAGVTVLQDRVVVRFALPGSRGGSLPGELDFRRVHPEGDVGHRGMDAVTSRRAEERLLQAYRTGRDPEGPAPARLTVRLRVEDGETVIGLKSGGTLRETRDPAELDAWIAVEARRLDDPVGEIQAEPEVPHADVIRIIDAFMQAKVTDITFQGVKQK